MKAVVFLGDSKIEVREYPDPKPGPDEVVLRVKASGMCGSDLHYLRSPKKSESDSGFIRNGRTSSPSVAIFRAALRASAAISRSNCRTPASRV